jgi:hypothetical protein
VYDQNYKGHLKGSSCEYLAGINGYCTEFFHKTTGLQKVKKLFEQNEEDERRGERKSPKRRNVNVIVRMTQTHQRNVSVLLMPEPESPSPSPTPHPSPSLSPTPSPSLDPSPEFTHLPPEEEEGFDELFEQMLIDEID